MGVPTELTNSHEALARFMVMHPRATLRELSAEFGYSMNYISLLRSTDAFKAKLRELNDAADGMVVADIPRQMRALTEVSLEKLAEAVEDAMTSGEGGRRDREFIKETTDMLLHRLGYAPKRDAAPAPAQPQAVILADAATVQGAVDKMMSRFAPPPEVDGASSPIEGESRREGTPE